MDAISLLKADHDKVKSLLSELESTTEQIWPPGLAALIRAALDSGPGTG